MIERLNDLLRREYENILIPAIEAALNRYEKVRLYYETGYDFLYP